MKKYPLVFRFHDMITGKGFMAEVIMDGRMLLVNEEDGDFWMFGVQPGGVSGGGCGRDAAFREFKMIYLSVLHDIAAESSTFEDFEQGVTEFFSEVNDPNKRDWRDVLKEVRKGNLTLTNINRVDADKRPPSLTVRHFIDPALANPTNNSLFGQIHKAA